jgi:hypothetical protein
MSAVEFIQQRGKLLQEAEEDIEHKFVDYMVETRVDGARDRDPAGRDVQGGEECAGSAPSKGRADRQTSLAKSSIGINIAQNDAAAVMKLAGGEAYKLDVVGKARVVKTRGLRSPPASRPSRPRSARARPQSSTPSRRSPTGRSASSRRIWRWAREGRAGSGGSLAALAPPLMRNL